MPRVQGLGSAAHAACSRTQLVRTLATSSSSSSSSALWPKLRVAIVGSGIAGPTLALLLKKHLGCTPVIFDQVPGVKEVGAGLSLAPNGLRVLDSLGLAQKVQHEVGEAFWSTDVFRPDGSRVVSVPTKLDRKDGDLLMMGIRRFRLLNTLLEPMQQMGIPLQLGKQLTDIQQQQITTSAGRTKHTAVLQFADGSEYEADLVVGCDGLKSRTRAIVKGGNEPPARYTGDEIVFAVTKGRHPDIIPPHTCCMIYGPGHQHFGSYGLGADCSWFTSVVKQEQSPESWGPVRDQQLMGNILDELSHRFKGWKLAEKMLEQEVAVMIRVGTYDREATPVWNQGVVTLAGDAASPIPPNLGQGGNKALEDAGVLAQCLVRHQGDVPAALQCYQSIRTRRARDLLKYSRQASQVASLESWWSRAARDIVLQGLVAVNGTIPSDWMWKYDCEEAVWQDK